MKTIDCHRDLIDQLGGNKVVADAIPCPPVRVGQWKIANRIPPEYWPRLIDMAAEKGFPDITAEWMMLKTPPREVAA
jgi:hypothetical protein